MNRRSFLKTLGMASALPAYVGCTSRLFTRSPLKMNVVYILADDLGWSELGSYGNRFNETPNIDRLAYQGMRFTDAYASAPVCSPYRAALMSGQYPARIGVTDYLRPDTAWHMPERMVTLPEMFKNAGYVTGMTGKWHLSGYATNGVKSGPGKHGFDEVMITEQTGIAGGSYFHPYNRVSLEIKPILGDHEYLVDRLNHEALQFIERNSDKPFLLYLSHYAVHTRLAGKSDLVNHFKAKPGSGKSKNNPVLAAMLKSIDEGVGMIMEKLKSLDLAENTIIVFTSDNGGESNVTSNAPLRAGKSCTYEGGIREPLLIKWPGMTKPGSVCDTPTTNVDFYPTFAELLDTERPAHHIDGESIMPLLKGGKTKERPLYWHYPLAKKHFLGGRSSGAIRLGNWKLIEYYDNRTLELYNLTDDIGEQHNLAEKRTGKAQKTSRHVEQVAQRSISHRAPRPGLC